MLRKNELSSFHEINLQRSVAIGCTKNYQPIEVTVHSHYVDSFELQSLKVFYSDSEKGGVQVNCETQFFLHPVCLRKRNEWEIMGSDDIKLLFS